LKQDASDNSSKKLSKIAELASILMSINNLEYKCTNRTAKPTLKFQVEGKDPVNYSLTKQRKQYAESQLQIISQYMMAFNDMLGKA
jgi:hypothetical protein